MTGKGRSRARSRRQRGRSASAGRSDTRTQSHPAKSSPRGNSNQIAALHHYDPRRDRGGLRAGSGLHSHERWQWSRSATFNTYRLGRTRCSRASSSSSFWLSSITPSRARRSASIRPADRSWRSTASSCITVTGAKAPVLLLHGNAVTGDDYNTSGVAERLLPNHRVIIFDRPGSATASARVGGLGRRRRRPNCCTGRWRSWEWSGPSSSATLGERLSLLRSPCGSCRYRGSRAALRLLLPEPPHRRASRRLGRDPDIRRHLALHDLAGFWLAHDAADQAHDVRALVDDQKVQGRIFHGHGAAAVPIRATVVDGASMVPSAANLRAHYRELAMPVVVIAGDGDMVESPPCRASARHDSRQRLADRPRCRSHGPPCRDTQVVQAIVQVCGGSSERTPTGSLATPSSPHNVPAAA